MSVQSYGAGWLLLTIVNIIWLLYFTSEEDSLIFHIINRAGGGTGGLTAPSRARRRNPSVHTANAGVRQSTLGNGGYGTGIGSNYGNTIGAGGIGSGFEDNGRAEVGMSSGTPKAGSFAGGGQLVPDNRSNKSGNAGASAAGGQSPRTPLMGPVSGADTSGDGARTSAGEISNYAYRARALYACELHRGGLRWILIDGWMLDQASPDDPNEISFAKGEFLDIVDNTGKWWQARKSDGTTGSESSLEWSAIMPLIASLSNHSCSVK